MSQEVQGSMATTARSSVFVDGTASVLGKVKTLDTIMTETSMSNVHDVESTTRPGTCLSHVMRKTDFCLCENKDTDQLCSNCTADQCLCFRYWDSTIPLLLKSEISSFDPSMTVQASLSQTWSEALKIGFLASWLI